MSTSTFYVSVIAALTMGVVTPSYAQTGARAGEHSTGTTLTPTWETSIGYQVLHVPDQTFPFGLNVDGARNFGQFGIAAEAGWSFDSKDDVSYNVLNFGAGPRWSGRSAASIWPFAQVMAGFVYADASGDNGDSRTKFMLQPGGGAVFVVGDGWGIIGQVDYRRVFLNKDDDGKSGENDFRVFVGIRFILE